MIRWVVRAGEEGEIDAVVALAGGDVRAVVEGRVFLGKRRVRLGSEIVIEGDVVQVALPRAASPRELRGGGSSPERTTPSIEILHRERDLVAVAKPAGISTIADHGGSADTLLALTALALEISEAELHPTSRLDREVSGVVVFALGKGAAARLKKARDEGRYERRYLAIAAPPSGDAGSEPHLDSRGVWDAPIGRQRDPRLRAIDGRDSVEARTEYAVIERPSRAVLLAVRPITGRTHQIRLHASHAGLPLYGDRHYGGALRIVAPTGAVVSVTRICLHAAWVSIPKANGGALKIAAPVPEELRGLWARLGGTPAAWDMALSCKFGPATSS